MVYGHGGDITGYIKRYGKRPLDFSANVNPVGISDAVLNAAGKALKRSGEYPDANCTELRELLAEKYEVSPENVICGCGAADIIYRAALAVRPDKALICAPTFSEYEGALKNAGSVTEYFALKEENGFKVTEDILKRIDWDTGMVFLAQPNNPTGRTVSPELMSRILEKCEEQGAVLVSDECFVDFLADPEKYSLRSSIKKSRNLLVINAFTKFYAMAGLRLGYGICSDSALIEKMNAAGPPWAVSGPAMAAGCAALKEERDSEKFREMIAGQREILRKSLEGKGFKVIPGEANFLLFYGRDDAAEMLAEKGILIRDCRNFRGLCPGWFRIAVRFSEENAVFTDILKEIF